MILYKITFDLVLYGHLLGKHTDTMKVTLILMTWLAIAMAFNLRPEEPDEPVKQIPPEPEKATDRPIEPRIDFDGMYENMSSYFDRLILILSIYSYLDTFVFDVKRIAPELQEATDRPIEPRDELDGKYERNLYLL